MSLQDRPEQSVGVGLVAGRYRLEALVGQGGMAAVHSAVDVRTGARVAVKLFRDPLVPGAEGEVRHGEVRALEGLRHPGLVELLDVGQQDGRPFCVMTLVEGQTLGERLSQGPLGTTATARLGSDLAAALAYVHDRGLVHRDIKPANVLLAPDGRARLADFGIARLVDATRVTRSGFTIGTAGYMAPEQVSGGRVTAASDVYALGLVLLECLTARREYDGPVIEAALARLHRRPQVPETLPAGWRVLLEALTAQDPERRPTAAVTASAAAVLGEHPAAPPEALRLDPVAQPEPGRAGTTSTVHGPVVLPASVDAEHVQVPAETRPPAVLPPRPSSGRPRSRARAAAGLAAALAAVAVGTTAALALRDGDPATVSSSPSSSPVAPAPSDKPSAAPTSSSPAAPPVAATPAPGAPAGAGGVVSPDEALDGLIAEVERASATDPAAWGAATPDVLRQLRRVAGLQAAEQAGAAVVTAEQVRQAVEDGRFQAAPAERVTPVLDQVAAPQDLVGLVRLSRADTAALGPGAARVERLLTTLDHRTKTADVPATAARLLQRVRDDVATGDLVPAFGRVATPVLEPPTSAGPLDALQDLVDELRRDPRAAGPQGQDVLDRLSALQEASVYRRTLGARELVKDIDDAADTGDLTEDFRERARAVLEALAQR